MAALVWSIEGPPPALGADLGQEAPSALPIILSSAWLWNCHAFCEECSALEAAGRQRIIPLSRSGLLELDTHYAILTLLHLIKDKIVTEWRKPDFTTKPFATDCHSIV
jgi:hypothetical protein